MLLAWLTCKTYVRDGHLVGISCQTFGRFQIAVNRQDIKTRKLAYTNLLF